MISKNIYKQLFKNSPKVLDPDVIKSCQDNLLKHGINYKDLSNLPDVELKLPQLQGSDVVDHFYNIGERQSAPYRNLLSKLSMSTLPPLPKNWSRMHGWCKYTSNGPPEPVPYPPDSALIFDVEVLMSSGKRPTLACAASAEAWYGWVSKPVANGDPHEYFENVNYDDLIPLETDGKEISSEINRPRIVVGHNVSYDRSKIKEQYWLNRTGVRFMDTMSMHTCISGVTSYQRTVLKAKNKEPHPSDDDWIDISSLNSLSEQVAFLTNIITKSSEVTCQNQKIVPSLNINLHRPITEVCDKINQLKLSDLCTTIKDPIYSRANEIHLKKLVELQRFNCDDWYTVRFDAQKKYLFTPGFVELAVNDSLKRFESAMLRDDPRSYLLERSFAGSIKALLCQKEELQRALQALVDE
ncbi:unnamed protein product [Parnassius apollo]|uniref:(apollo) hypothetical protein n=1 Tax=Parnassius apollo TaxID=110799 RepID=A0A8S3W3G0_PARAO|nr:unnamed protein product [Parnassius apollo]